MDINHNNNSIKAVYPGKDDALRSPVQPLFETFEEYPEQMITHVEGRLPSRLIRRMHIFFGHL